MSLAMSHLIVVPILLPLLTAAVMLVLGERRLPVKALVNLVSSGLGLAVAVALLAWVAGRDAPLAFGIYLPANWPVPFGIVLVLDRLSALMLVLAGALGLASALFSMARWQRAGVHFNPLFQIQLMGLNGAFLTADLFNLFVFFEVMLVASYGLLLHGSGRARVRAGLHYIACNLLASSLLLVGVTILYGVTGTLNMADMAQKLAAVAPADRGLMYAGAALLGLAFLAKAALWPLNAWLVPAYAAAGAPVAAVFAILTKVGVYALLRLWTLFFPAQDAALAPFGGDALVWGGLATLAFGMIGVLASQHLDRLAGFSLIVSAGTLITAIGFGRPSVTAGALYYLLVSTLASAALFLLIELIERSRHLVAETPLPEIAPEKAPFVPEPAGRQVVPEGVNLDDFEKALIGQPIPAAVAFLGVAFVACALLLSGLPPLPGFIAKLAILSALLNPAGLGIAAAPPVGAAWVLIALLIGSGLASAAALSRAGIRYFWAPKERPLPRLRPIECLPIAGLLLACAALAVGAGPALRYASAAAEALHAPSFYIDAVLSARPVPAPAKTP